MLQKYLLTILIVSFIAINPIYLKDPIPFRGNKRGIKVICDYLSHGPRNWQITA